MRDFDFVLKRLSGRKKTLREIADGSGVPYDTVTKISQGKTRNPRVDSIHRLRDYFQRLSA